MPQQAAYPNRILDSPTMTRQDLDLTLPASWDTAAAALTACARALGDPRDVGAIAAASGLAMRISVDQRLTAAGPHRYPWRDELTAAAERLGFGWRLVASRAGEPLFARAMDEAFALAVAGVEAGRPTLLFGVQVAEFGIVRGHDGDDLIVSGLLDGAGAPTTLARGSLGESGILFALQLVERHAIDPAMAARAALRAAVEHGRGDDFAPEGVATGAAAWARLVDGLGAGFIDPSGLAFSVQRFAEARGAFARWLPVAAAALALDLGEVERPMRRAAAMMAELARLLPFPPPATGMLTTTLREQAQELAREAARAEAEALTSIERTLAEEERASAARDLRVEPLDAARLPSLFACVDEIPIAGLRAEAAARRERLAPALGRAIDGRLLYRDGALVGHVLWAPLEEALQPVAARGRRWFVFCPWLAAPLRGHGLGGRLFAALDEAARAAGVDGLLTFATSIDVFLHHRGLERHGFVEVDRRGDTRLLERSLTGAPSQARITDPPPPRADGPLPVIVRHAYHCPLLLRVRRDAAAAARALAPQVALDEADASPGEPAGVVAGGRPLAHAPIPAAALVAGLADAAKGWR